MTKMHRLSIFFGNTLRVALFCLLMIWWGIQLDPMMSELYLVTPFIVFSCVAVFLFLFLCRETGCLLFLEKGRLKAILRNDEPDPTASQIVLRLFSNPFLKRVTMYFVLFVAEFYLRLLCINPFLKFVQGTLPFWERITSVSENLLYVLMFAGAYVIMELPAWVLFYKLSFKGRSDRSYEYRFGMKLSFLVSLIAGLYILSISLTADAPEAVENAAFVLFVVLSFGVWHLMYRKKCCCGKAGGCRIRNAVRSLFRKRETPEKTSAVNPVKESEPEKTPDETPVTEGEAEKTSDETPEKESSAQTPENADAQRENEPEKTEENAGEIPAVPLPEEKE